MIWRLFKTSKDTDDKWGKKMGIPIDRGIFFAKDVVVDITKLHFSHSGGSVSLRNCEKGISNMLVLSRTPGEVEAIRLFEAAAAATKATRTLKEMEKISSSEKRHPPMEYHSLKLMVATYAALIFVLFGEKCHLYANLMKIYMILDLEEVYAVKHAFTSMICKSITWAIFEDSRMFFWRKKSPLDFDPGRPIEFCRSMLEDIMSDVRYQRWIERGNFPVEWREQLWVPQTPALPPMPSPMGFLSPYTSVFGSYGVPPPPPPPPPSDAIGDKRKWGPQHSTAEHDSGVLAHCHQKVIAALQHYHQKFHGRVMLSRLMQLGNIKFKDLPVLPDMIDKKTNRSKLCYNYCLGICPHQNCEYAKVGGHIHGSQLPGDFVDKLIAVIEPGAKAAFALNPAPVGSGGGSLGKRVCF